MTTIRIFGGKAPVGAASIALAGLLLIAGMGAYTTARDRSERSEAIAEEFSKNANLAFALEVYTN